ncbi:PQQ-dependent sugar dehydrogenase [Haloflavibacter putidus]|uniref:Sorbosone dehydrogenase family protein n=1 Tax=Haloflavibacter putidus TaxID=2576776 RepID=A0A507ZSI5_9FLAO|nr:sorbosone dehydrogenase family protein [Haloflavibacter putidus]TQD38678.1 sorbosone dehydrogenase family protein [Haloflavibacter putidus]
MKTFLQLTFFSIASLLFFSCKEKVNKNQSQAAVTEQKATKETKQDSGFTTVETAIGELRLPPPYHTQPSTKISQIVNWEENEKPKAPTGFTVMRFADNLKHPRRTYVSENGDYFVAESDDAKNSANQIRLLRDTNADGMPDENHVFLENLNQPYGMLILDDYFYVANVDAVVRFPYKEGQTKITAKPEKILDLPSGGYNHHWTRNLIANQDQTKIYVSVGSSSNVGEHGMDKEKRRANILEINPDGSGEKIYAAGLRNPVGMDWNPVTGELWTAVNERDALGDKLVPDYATSVKEGAWYGWPYSYFGQIKDPRWKDKPHLDKVEKAIIPDVSLGSHTASLGFQFYTAEQFAQKYKNGAFVGQHGSWNRSNFAGYKVVFIPFTNGKPQKPEDFLTGFIKDKEESLVHGRPVGVAQATDGSLLVNDDDAGIIWRVTKK